MGKVQIELGGKLYDVDQHSLIYLMAPEPQAPDIVTAVFFNESKIPTHVANWTRPIVKGLIKELQEKLLYML